MLESGRANGMRNEEEEGFSIANKLKYRNNFKLLSARARACARSFGDFKESDRRC